jgi:hypothetical protein
MRTYVVSGLISDWLVREAIEQCIDFVITVCAVSLILTPRRDEKNNV